ncbi:MAG: hypothetical protein J6Y04_08330 [Bacteroidaceae bacterium]|nr:hypothetical protein [Bacteroidaceae bacterium]
MDNGPLGDVRRRLRSNAEQEWTARPLGRLRRATEQEWIMDNGQWIIDNR